MFNSTSVVLIIITVMPTVIVGSFKPSPVPALANVTILICLVRSVAVDWFEPAADTAEFTLLITNPLADMLAPEITLPDNAPETVNDVSVPTLVTLGCALVVTVPATLDTAALETYPVTLAPVILEI